MEVGRHPTVPSWSANIQTAGTGVVTVTSHNPLEELTLDQLRKRTSAKWRTYPEDVLPLWVAEMDVLLAEPILHTLDQALRAGDTGYPAGTDYAEALSAFALSRWGWNGLAIERSAIVPDVMLGIVEVLRLITRPGSPVVVNCPVYPPFYPFIEHMDRHIVEAPLGVDGRLDLDALQAAFLQAIADDKPAAYLLCSPHNPTGTVHTAAELASVASLASRHGVRVVVDEIHAPLVLPGARFVPYLSVPGTGTGFSLMSASKGWNLAGLKAALVIAGPDAADDLARLPEEVSHGPSHLGIIAHTAALREGAPWLDSLLSGLDQNRRMLGQLLDYHLPAVGYRPPEATFLAWLDCAHLNLGSPTDQAAQRGLVTLNAGPAALFLEHGRVAVSAGLAFGTGGDTHVRLNFATSQAVLSEAVRRMAEAVDKQQQ
jgi:cysteine-S-conjugate beta-lyase